MNRKEDQNIHPGEFIRNNVIPPGLSVKETAEILGIGRPALSNFLNGNSSLSNDMAMRIEKAFGIDKLKLMNMQVAYDLQNGEIKKETLAVRSFVPSFLIIKANQIEYWASKELKARSLLPVLLRKLVNSTCSSLSKVDFPGYDNAQRKGSDGLTESSSATPWIPIGKAYWEFGTDAEIKRKADNDYTSRLKTIDAKEREKSTFIFLTPRNWTQKKDWVEKKKNNNDWKDIRAYDASDLEQWLEQSIPAQIWFSEQLSIPNSGYKTLDQAWHQWANGCDPNITRDIFKPSVSQHIDKFKDWLDNPTKKPFTIASDSKDEAIAFLSCMLNDDVLIGYKDISAIFTKPEPLQRTLTSSAPFIPIVMSDEVEKVLTNAQAHFHYIVICLRNEIEVQADLILDLPSYDSLKNALALMGIEENAIDRLIRESGGSPTILRRRLSTNKAIRTPSWVNCDESDLIVILSLIGVWKESQKADCEIVSYLADRTYDEIVFGLAKLLQNDDSPVWSVGNYRGVVSKIDALFATAKLITKPILERFFLVAEIILSELDPALELPEKDRWAAAIYGKFRDHSGALRNSITETLILLSVHGNHLFNNRLGMNVNMNVSSLIERLLTPLSRERLLSNENDLPRYAEAAPDKFLEIIQKDLKSTNPTVFNLFKPVNSNPLFGSPMRTGLLWALECLTWKPEYLTRVSLILAQLSKIKTNDNWLNTAEGSLKSIYSFWIPQTSATIEQRINAFESLVKKFPEVGWIICIDQFQSGEQYGNFTYRPRWRNDASDAGYGVNSSECNKFLFYCLDTLTSWPYHNEETLSELIEKIHIIPEEYQNKVWALIDDWQMQANDTEKAVLRERVRKYALIRRGSNNKIKKGLYEKARNVYNNLEPENLVIKHSWLFAEYWVPESIDECEDEHYDYRKREERIDKLRHNAIAEILADSGSEGIGKLIEISNASSIIGQKVAQCIIDKQKRVDFIVECFSFNSKFDTKITDLIQGFLLEIDVSEQKEIICDTASKIEGNELKLFLSSPFCLTTWQILNEYDSKMQDEYWQQVTPSWRSHTDDELPEIIDRLLIAKRPRTTIHAIHIDLKRVDTDRLRKLLNELVTSDSNESDSIQLQSYDVEEILDILQNREDVTSDEMAMLEYQFINILHDKGHGIKHLEKKVSESPEWFVRAIVFISLRNDGNNDPPEFIITDQEKRDSIIRASYNLLDRVSRLPGLSDNGELNLRKLFEWIKEVRRLCHEYGRGTTGDKRIGRVLSKAPVSENGDWPNKVVCEALEEFSSIDMGNGFRRAVYNSRGIHTRQKGGNQERELAEKYRKIANNLHFKFPFVGNLFEDLAKTYEQEAAWHDSEADLHKRLN